MQSLLLAKHKRRKAERQLHNVVIDNAVVDVVGGGGEHALSAIYRPTVQSL